MNSCKMSCTIQNFRFHNSNTRWHVAHTNVSLKKSSSVQANIIKLRKTTIVQLVLIKADYLYKLNRVMN